MTTKIFDYDGMTVTRYVGEHGDVKVAIRFQDLVEDMSVTRRFDMALIHQLYLALGTLVAPRSPVPVEQGDGPKVWLTLSHVQQVNANRTRRWHHDTLAGWSVLEWAGAMCGEAGEAANIAKKIRRLQLAIPGNREHEQSEAALRDHLAGELAGTFLYLLLVAEHQGIDINDAVRSEFNKRSVECGFPERL